MSQAFFLELDAISDLCRRFHVRRLDVFGSVATGRGFNPDTSDLDLLVAFDDMPSTDYANAYFGLREGLEALSGRSIDLVTEAALINPYLRARVVAERLTLFPVSSYSPRRWGIVLQTLCGGSHGRGDNRNPCR